MMISELAQMHAGGQGTHSWQWMNGEWMNRAMQEIGDVPPAEHEADWYVSTRRPARPSPHKPRCTRPGVAHQT
jgi:hypothetical protein